MNWKHDACLVVITLLFAVLLYNVTDVFQISRKWVAQPQYLVDSDLYVKKSDLKPDSTNHLMWSANLCDSINQTQVDSKDKFMTAEEFSSNITSYYGTLIDVLIGLFILLSVFSYFSYSGKIDNLFQAKATDIDSLLKQIETELNNQIKSAHKQEEARMKELVIKSLSDSISIRGYILQGLTSDVEDMYLKKEEAYEIKEKLDTLIREVNFLQEVYDEFIYSDKEIE